MSILQLCDTRLPQPNRYQDYDVPAEISQAADLLLTIRNTCDASLLPTLDEAIVRLLEPWLKFPDDSYVIIARNYHSEHVLDSWTLAGMIKCKQCQGRLLWAEAGHVPGYRLCERCGRSWLIQPTMFGAAMVILIKIPETSTGPAWSNEDSKDISEEAYQAYCDNIRACAGHPISYQTWKQYQ